MFGEDSACGPRMRSLAVSRHHAMWVIEVLARLRQPAVTTEPATSRVGLQIEWSASSPGWWRLRSNRSFASRRRKRSSVPALLS